MKKNSKYPLIEVQDDGSGGFFVSGFIGNSETQVFHDEGVFLSLPKASTDSFKTALSFDLNWSFWNHYTDILVTPTAAISDKYMLVESPIINSPFIEFDSREVNDFFKPLVKSTALQSLLLQPIIEFKAEDLLATPELALLTCPLFISQDENTPDVGEYSHAFYTWGKMVNGKITIDDVDYDPADIIDPGLNPICHLVYGLQMMKKNHALLEALNLLGDKFRDKVAHYVNELMGDFQTNVYPRPHYLGTLFDLRRTFHDSNGVDRPWIEGHRMMWGNNQYFNLHMLPALKSDYPGYVQDATEYSEYREIAAKWKFTMKVQPVGANSGGPETIGWKTSRSVLLSRVNPNEFPHYFEPAEYVDSRLSVTVYDSETTDEYYGDRLTAGHILELVELARENILNTIEVEHVFSESVFDNAVDDPVSYIESHSNWSIEKILSDLFIDNPTHSDARYFALLASALQRAEDIPACFSESGILVNMTTELLILFVETMSSFEEPAARYEHFKRCFLTLESAEAAFIDAHVNDLLFNVEGKLRDAINHANTASDINTVNATISSLGQYYNGSHIVAKAAKHGALARWFGVRFSRIPGRFANGFHVGDPVLSARGIHSAVSKHFDDIRKYADEKWGSLAGEAQALREFGVTASVLFKALKWSIKEIAKFIWTVVKSIGSKIFHAAIYTDNVYNLYYAYGQLNYPTFGRVLTNREGQEPVVFIPLGCVFPTHQMLEEATRDLESHGTLWIQVGTIKKRVCPVVRGLTEDGIDDIFMIVRCPFGSEVYRQLNKLSSSFSWNEMLAAITGSKSNYVPSDIGEFLLVSAAADYAVSAATSAAILARSQGSLIGGMIRAAVVSATFGIANAAEAITLAEGTVVGIGVHSDETGAYGFPSYSFLYQGKRVFIPNRYIAAAKGSQVAFNAFVAYQSAAIAAAIALEVGGGIAVSRVLPHLNSKKLLGFKEPVTHTMAMIEEIAPDNAAIALAKTFYNGLSHAEDDFRVLHAKYIAGVDNAISKIAQYSWNSKPAIVLRNGTWQIADFFRKRAEFAGFFLAKAVPAFVAGAALSVAKTPFKLVKEGKSVVYRKKVKKDAQEAALDAEKLLKDFEEVVSPGLKELLSRKTRVYNG